MTKEEFIKQRYSCTCDMIYTSRNMVDPSCVLHEHGPEFELLMDEYAKYRSIAFAEWVMENCCQDLGNPDEDRWMYHPTDSENYDEKISDELYAIFLLSQQTQE